MTEEGESEGGREGGRERGGGECEHVRRYIRRREMR